MALTPKQSAFVAEYLKDLNATQAAIRAGYSEATAGAIGAENLTKPEIRRAVDEALQRRAERVEVKADDVLRELLRLAMVDVGEAFDEHGQLKALKDMTPDVRRAIAAIEVEDREDGRVRKVRFWDKKGALELLGKHLKLFTEKIEHSADSSFADMLKAARERAGRR